MLSVSTITLRCKTRRPVRLHQFMGSAWRGALGHRLRRRTCLTGAATCTGCALTSRCTYYRMFEAGPPPGTPLLEAYRDAPRPYVIRAQNARSLPTGHDYCVEITLFGHARRYAPTVAAAMRAAVRDVSEEFFEESCDIRDYAPTDPSPAPGGVQLILDSPLRLRVRGEYLRPEQFRFASFFSALLRRCVQLSAIYGDGPPALDPRALTDLAAACTVSTSLSWQRLTRYSSRQKRRIPLDGLTGSFTVRGELAPLWPWLWTGQWLHVGKAADMGLGRYRLVPIAS